MTHITCRLTAKNQDQLQNPTLGNRVWAAFLVVVYWHYLELISQRQTPYQHHDMEMYWLMSAFERKLK